MLYKYAESIYVVVTLFYGIDNIMNVVESRTSDIRQTLNELIGEITAKNLFTGYGLYKEGIMFGIYQNGIFYLRAEKKLASYLESQGAVSFTVMEPNSRVAISNYYHLPKALTRDKELFKKLIELSIQQVKAQKLSDELSKKTRIKDLPNLTIKHERLLMKINVNTVQQFKVVGAVFCYVKLKSIGIPVNINLFWNLSAALLNKNVNLLTLAEKENLLVGLNKKLEREGFKAINLL